MISLQSAIRGSLYCVLALLSMAHANAVTVQIIVPPIVEPSGTIDARFRVTATAAETAVGQGCFIDGEFGVTTPSTALPIAEDGTDYVAPELQFVSMFIPPGGGDFQDEVVLSIPIINDQQVEPVQEAFGLQFVSFSEGVPIDCFGTQIPAVIDEVAVINEDDALQYAFAPEFVTVDETSGTVSADLALLNPAEAPLEYSAGLAVSAQSGTALAGSDFEALAQNLPFDQNQTLNSIAVTLIDDNESEPDEVFRIAEAAGTSAVDGSGNPLLVAISNATTVTIVSDDVPDTLAMAQGNLTIAEDGGSAQVSVVRTGTLAGVVSVSYSTQPGTAIQPEDYQTTNGTLTFSDGDAGPQVISIPIVDDGLNEAGEFFEVQLASPQGNAVLGADLTQVDITDNDLDQLGFANAVLSVDEGTGTVVLDVVRSGSAIGSVSVDFQSVAGSAADSVDFTAVSGTLSFAPGDLGPRQITIDITDDAANELAESFDVVLSNPVGDAEITAGTSSVTINDNDLDEVSFSVSAASVDEAGGSIVLDVVRTGTALGEVSVEFQTIAGTATEDTDYIGATGVLSFAAGDFGPQQVQIDITDDTLSDANETFDVVLSNPSGALALGSAVVTVTIIDDEVPAPDTTYSFSAATFSVVESDGSLLLSVTRNGDISGSGSVDFETVAGSASAGSDYLAQSDTLNFAPGEPGPLDVVVQIVQDATIESDEAFSVELTNPVGGAIGVGGGTAVVTISDVPPAPEGDLIFPSGDFSVAEDGGTLTIGVARVNGTAGTLSVDYSVTTVGAVLGEDFEFTPGQLQWVDGEAGEKSFEINLIDDDIVEDPETITVSLGNFSASALSGSFSAQGLGDPSSINITLVDNDVGAAPGSGGEVAFVEDSVTVNEEEGTVELEVARSGSAVGEVSVDWTTVADSATADNDFVASSGTLTWADGDTANKSISIALTSDITIEGVEEFSLELSNAQGADVGTAAVATVVISDVGQSLAETPGLNPQELELARTIDSSCENLVVNGDGDNADQQDLLFICGTLRNGLETPEQVRDALDAISGDELITAAASTLKLLGLQHNTFRNRLSGLRSGNTGIFDVSGLAVEIDGQFLSGAVLEEIFGALSGGAAGDTDFGRLSFYVNGKLEFGEKDRDSANRGYDFDAQMLTLGADYRLNDKLFIGAALGYEMADVKFAQGGALDVGGWKGSVYGSYFSGDAFFVDVQASYGKDDYSSERRIVYDYVGGSIDRTAEGDTKGDQVTTGIASGFDYNRGRFTFGPNVALAYFDVGVNSFTEEGAGGLNLAIGRQVQRSLTFTGGAHASFVINTKLGVVIPHARIDYVHEFLTSPEFSNVRFVSDPLTGDLSTLTRPLQIEAETIDKNYLLWSVGTSMQLVHGLSGYVSYQSTEGYSGLKLQQVAYGLRLEKTY